MSIIKFCGLGGLGENGKNLYTVSVDEKIFILDAGAKEPSVELYGVDAVISDISYIIENKSKVVGIFLSHAHEENVGAVALLLDNLSVPVFGSNFTISYVELCLKELGRDIENYRLYRINDDKVLTFGDVTVSFFNTTHSVPQSMGISINTVDGSIVYLPDFCLSFTKDNLYQTSFDRLARVSENKVLMLCTESLGVNNYDRVTNDYTFNFILKDYLLRGRRTIITCYSYDLLKIQKVIDICVACKRKVAIIGRKTQRVVNIALEKNFLRIPKDSIVNLRFRDNFNNNDDPNLVFLVTGVSHEPYYMLQRMVYGQDRLCQLTKSDIVLILTPSQPTTEAIATRTIDALNKTVGTVVKVPKNVMRSNHADGEDLKMIYQIINPEYICPIIGEYRHQYAQSNIAKEAGYNKENIIVLDNGEVITFIDGELQQARERVKTGDVLIDGSIVGDINEVILKDRETLASYGAIILTCDIDSNYHRIVSFPKVVSKGFMNEKDEDYQELANRLIDNATIIIKDFLKKEVIDWNDLKQTIRDMIDSILKEYTKSTPIIIPVIIDINGDNL